MLLGQTPKERLTETLILVGATPMAALVLGYIILLQHFTIPATSMVPNLMVGDFLVADRFRTPWHSDVARGDVVVFDAPNGVWVKRIIGLPGEQVQLRQGQVLIDGTPVKLVELNEDMTVLNHTARVQAETLPEGKSYRVLDSMESAADNTKEYDVPEGHYFVLGDNRDNSADSRFGLGMVPDTGIRGKVRFILFNSAGKSRSGRVL